MVRVLRILTGIVCLCATAPVAHAQEAIPLKTLEDIKAASVFLKVEIGPIEVTGTGFVIRTEGDTHYVVTNQHVISVPTDLADGLPPTARTRERLAVAQLQRELLAAKPKVQVVFRSGTKQEQEVTGEVIAADEDRDLAILKVKGVGNAPKPIAINQSLKLAETTPVFVFGFPFGKVLSTSAGSPAITVGKGSVSSLRLDDDGNVALVQIDGALNPGNSGGPVVDAQGRLAGVAVASFLGAGIGLAIPPGEVTRLLDGRMGKASAAQRAVSSGPPEIDLSAILLDPFKKIKTVTANYVIGEVTNDALTKNQRRVAGLPGSGNLDLKLDAGRATGKFALKSASTGPLVLTVQLVYTTTTGKTEYANPQVIRNINPVGGSPQLVQANRPAGPASSGKPSSGASGPKTSFDYGDSAANGGSTPPGAKVAVEVEWGRRWWPAEIVEQKGETYYIKYIGWSSSFNEWVGKDRIRFPNGKPPVAAASADPAKPQTSNAPAANAPAGKPPQWTLDVTKMKLPDATAFGTMHGEEFAIETASVAGGVLTLRQGAGFHPDKALLIFLFLRPNESLAGKAYRIRPGDFQAPHIYVKHKAAGDSLPRTTTFPNRYAMLLEFGQMNGQSGLIPGKIYVCLPDKTVLAGSFDVSLQR